MLYQLSYTRVRGIGRADAGGGQGGAAGLPAVAEDALAGEAAVLVGDAEEVGGRGA